jgi:hypothetical protein
VIGSSGFFAWHSQERVTFSPKLSELEPLLGTRPVSPILN